MSLEPDSRARIARCLTDLRMGLPVILRHDGHVTFAAAAETLNEARLTALRALGPAHLTITDRRAAVLKIRVYDGDLARITLPDRADAAWIAGLADPSGDMNAPMRGPFREMRGGDVAMERAAIRLAKLARLLPALVMVPGAEVAAGAEGLSSLNIADLGEDAPVLRDIIAGRVPLASAPNTRLHVFGDGADFAEHYAVEFGQPDRSAPVLCRLHSACFTGDVLGSLKCDCGPQLDAALAAMAAEGAGILLYLNQEGRGIGLSNKMRAYSLQDQGFDTVDANHRLGFEDDERDFRIGSGILTAMGFSAVRLMTNNPAKVTAMEATEITVTERVPHVWGVRSENEGYLATKASRSGHLI